MQTTSFIYRHITRLPDQGKFTTRECLIYGSRAAVDQALHRFVKKRILIRLARGVFMKRGAVNSMPTAFEVASLKATAFGKVICIHAGARALQLGLQSDPTEPSSFFVSGRSSSFQYGQQRIKLIGRAMRKVRLGGSKASEFIAALWYLGQEFCKQDLFKLAKTALLGRTDKEELVLSKPWMPVWLSEHFPVLRYYDPHQQIYYRRSGPDNFLLPLPLVLNRPRVACRPA